MDILEENAKTLIEGNSRGDLRSIEGECAGERRVCDCQSRTLVDKVLRLFRVKKLLFYFDNCVC